VVAGASIPFHDDPTNALPDVRRNRIRWDVIPALRREGLDPSLLWENFHDQTDDMDVTRPPASHVMIDRRMFQGASRSAVKRALDVGLASLGLSPAPRTMTTAVARGFSLEGQDPAAPGRFQFYTKDVLLWAGSTTPLWMIPARSALYEKPVALPEDDGGAVRVSYAGRHKTVVLEPGETMQCFSPGLRARMKDGTHKKLKDLLQESHLPPPVRLNLPLIVGADGFVKIILFSFWEDLRDRHCH
ncbi:MAG: tRNA lysidine(34) synthetase TilS, partial [Spirochaetia bacterium]|nr:tRNA lysidine(34) synthetase TilS [Spirochaetia bacterium]